MNYSIFSLRVFWAKIKGVLNVAAEALIMLASLASLFILIYQFGFHYSSQTAHLLMLGRTTLLLAFFLGISLRYILKFKEIVLEKMIYLEVSIYFFLFTVLSCRLFFKEAINNSLPYLSFFEKPFFTYILLLFLSIIHLSRQAFSLLQTKIKPSLLFTLSFIFMILIGAGLLMLPNATVRPIHFIDALFTSTTSVCVTGLTTVDISSTFTFTGMIIILLLIQIGGIGVMTFTSFFALSFLGKYSFNSQLILKDILNEDRINGLFGFLINIIFVTLFIESIGAYLIYLSVMDTLPGGVADKIFYSVFHSVSAFCNAGISTLSGNMYDPLVVANYKLHIWIACLIIFGGLGFPIVFNYLKLFRHYVFNTFNILIGKQKNYNHIPRIININTYIVIVSTLILVGGGTIIYYILEASNSLAGLSFKHQMANAFLGAVTPRTAGFNVADMSTLATSTLMLTLVLMVIGAAPMSTAGGLKVTTVWIALLSAHDAIRGKNKVEVRRREIAPDAIRRCFATIIFYFGWSVFVIFLLTIIEKDAPVFTLIFETISALSTVGLSINYTPHLSDFGKILIILTMLIGRIGVLTFFMSFYKEYKQKNYSYPKENILM